MSFLFCSATVSYIICLCFKFRCLSTHKGFYVKNTSFAMDSDIHKQNSSQYLCIQIVVNAYRVYDGASNLRWTRDVQLWVFFINHSCQVFWIWFYIHFKYLYLLLLRRSCLDTISVTSYMQLSSVLDAEEKFIHFMKELGQNILLIGR